MTAPLHPDLIPGWLIDDVLDERTHTVVVAARGAEPVTPPAQPRFATIVITRPGHQDAAERELDALVTAEAITRADIIEATIVMWDGNGVVARVLRPGVTYASVPARDPAPDAAAAVLGAPAAVLEAIDERLELDPKIAVRGAYVMIAVALVAVVFAVFVSLPRESSQPGARPADRVGVVTWDPLTAIVSVERGGRVLTYRLGESGDELLLGDWQGNGERNPALYRPSTGEVWLFTEWATADSPAEPKVAVQGPAHGRAVVEPKDGRDFVVVDPPEAAP